MTARKTIPLIAADPEPGVCAGTESFALLVLGDSMAPEFVDGEVIIVEPEGLASDGSFVVAQLEGEWTFRQLVAVAGCWKLRALNPAHPEIALADLSPVRGVVIQKSKPGRRRARKHYVD